MCMRTCSNHNCFYKIKKMTAKTMKGASWFWIFVIRNYSYRMGCLCKSSLKKTDLPSKEGFVTETCWRYGEVTVKFSQELFSVSLLCSFLIIWDGIPLCCPGWLWIYNPSALASWVAGIRSRCHHARVHFHIKKRSVPDSINISVVCLWAANLRG